VLGALDLLAPLPWLVLLVASVGSAGTIAYVMVRRPPSKTWPWWSICAAYGLFLVGNLLRQLTGAWSDFSGGRSLYPDAVTIVGYILLASGLMGFVRARGRVSGRSLGVVLDGLMAALALLACCWVLLIEPVLAHREASAIVRLLVVCYPAMSLFLMVPLPEYRRCEIRHVAVEEQCLVDGHAQRLPNRCTYKHVVSSK
jgi:hypothetical protein